MEWGSTERFVHAIQEFIAELAAAGRRSLRGADRSLVGFDGLVVPHCAGNLSIEIQARLRDGLAQRAVPLERTVGVGLCAAQRQKRGGEVGIEVHHADVKEGLAIAGDRPGSLLLGGGRLLEVAPDPPGSVTAEYAVSGG